MNTELLATTVASFGLPTMLGSFFASQPYGIIFVCLLIGAGIILLPAFYLVLNGALNFFIVLGVMVLAALVSDSFWYLIGRGAMPDFIASRIEKGKYLKKIAHVAAGKELVLLFYSKFIYGTRIATQLYCGSQRINYGAFIGINMLTTIIVGCIYFSVVKVTAVSVESLGDLKHKLPLILLAGMIVMGLFHLLFHTFFKKRIFGA